MTRPAIVITRASAGIGQAFATYLGQKGHTLGLLARDEDALVDAAARANADAHVMAVDLSAASAPDAIEVFLNERGLHAEVLINNAGVGFDGAFEIQTANEVEQILNVNVAALVRLSHKLLPGMCDRGRGGILNVASLAGFMPGPHQALYFASKAFVLSFSQAIADECASKSVHVMAAAPGPVEMRIHNAMTTQWSFYKQLFPAYELDQVVKGLWDGFTTGHRVLLPGLISNLAAVAATFVPNEILIPSRRFSSTSPSCAVEAYQC